MFPNVKEIDNNSIVIEHEGKQFRIITEGVKLKKLRKLQKILKKGKATPESIIPELTDIGIRVEEVKEESSEKES